MNAAFSSPSSVATFAAEIDAEGVLFDMDGVLVCSTGGDERCWMRWAEHHKLTFDIRRTHGRRAADTLREHLPAADDGAIREHLAQLDTFAAEEQSGVIAYPGVRELLRTLPPYRWTVVTSASESMMRDRLRGAGIAVPAEVVAGDHVAKGKPDPEGYRRGAALLSRSPGDCVVIEDAPAGVRAGKRAGSRVIGVLSSHAPDELHEADWLVQSIDRIAVEIDESATLKLRFPALVRDHGR